MDEFQNEENESWDIDQVDIDRYKHKLSQLKKHVILNARKRIVTRFRSIITLRDAGLISSRIAKKELRKLFGWSW